MNDLNKPGGVKLRSPQDMAGGIFLIALGVLALFLTQDLPMGTLRAMGPAMLPRSLGVITAFLGVLLCLSALRFDGPGLERWTVRGLFFIMAGILLFGLTIRGFDIGPVSVPQLGLLVAGPLLVLVSGCADPDTRWKELIIFAVSMTAMCAGLFKYALNLPIPLAPWLLGI
jgi:Tripartite tricarboxylate transporter TctB family